MPRASRHNPATDCPHCGRTRVWIGENTSSCRQYCGPCHSASSYKSRKKRAQIYNIQIAVRRQTDVDFRAYEIWHNAKSRAIQRGIEFSIERSFVESGVKSGHCAVTGLPFDLVLKNKRMGSFSPSLDRINPKIGYVPGNVQVVCWIYNRAKGDGTHLDVLKLAEALNAIEIARTA